MEPMIQEVMAHLVPVVAGLLATLVSVGLVRLNRWLQAKGNMESLSAASELVAATVNDLNATVVKKAKQMAADGKLTADEAMRIKEFAVSHVKKQLPKSVVKAASCMVGDLDAYVRGKIEQEVAASKGA